jgi:peptide/nickel transport system permease protein/glutathione transport system permease protein
MTALITRAAASARPRRTLRAPASVLFAGAILVLFAVAALCGPALVPQSADAQDLLLGAAPPAGDHWLGTDQLGRDVFSRLVVATGSALVGPLLVALVTMTVGSTLGLVAGARGGRVDAAISRAADLIWSLPGLLVAIVVIGVIDGGIWLTILVIAFLSIPHAIRQTRSATLAQIRRPYVEAARTLGLSSATIMRRHILPNVRATVLTTALLDFVAAILVFAALAFLRIGVEPGVASWGAMLADGQSLFTVNPFLIAAPAVAIVAVAASVTVIGDWAQSVASKGDPR